MTKAEKIKYLLTPAIGFGIGGALSAWRWSGFLWNAELSNFTFILGAIFFGFFGSLSLVVFLEDIKIIKKVFIVLGGLFLCLVGFYIWSIGFLFLALVFPPGIISFPLLLGAVIALFFALALKTKMWPVVWRGGIGFVLAFVIGLALGGLIGGELLNSEFLAGIIGFALTGIILGLFLGWGLYKGQKVKT